MKRALLVTWMALAVGPLAMADSFVSGLYNTGVDANGVAFTTTALDPHYKLTAVPSGSTLGQAQVRTGTWPVAPAGPWLANTSVSAWISPQNDVRNIAGLYSYETEFAITNQFGGSISGRWSSDNNGVSIKLNDQVQTIVQLPAFGGFGQWYSFTLNNSDFKVGTNKLEFVVNNGVQSSGNPTGLRVEYKVPEGAEAVSLIGMLSGVLWMARRRKSQQDV